MSGLRGILTPIARDNDPIAWGRPKFVWLNAEVGRNAPLALSARRGCRNDARFLLRAYREAEDPQGMADVGRMLLSAERNGVDRSGVLWAFLCSHLQ